MMINTDKTFCTYENIYYEMWEIAGRYTEIAQFQVDHAQKHDRVARQSHLLFPPMF